MLGVNSSHDGRNRHESASELLPSHAAASALPVQTALPAETRLPGLADHCVVQASHSGLVLSPEVADLTAAFLRAGRFREGAARRAA